MKFSESRRIASELKPPLNIKHTEGIWLSSGVSKCFVFFEVLDGLTTKNGAVVPSTYCLGTSATPPVVPSAEV